MAYETWPDLDPEEKLDFGFDWTDRLEDAETIVTSVWTVAEGDVTIDSQSNTTAITKVWLTGGTVDSTCIVNNHITLSSGRERDRSAKLKIKAK